jgi:hypothetical protein
VLITKHMGGCVVSSEVVRGDHRSIDCSSVEHLSESIGNAP